MRISLNWLKDYIDLDVPVAELAHQMTMLGLEIEAIEQPGKEIQEVYVGKILSIDAHPDADKLVVCQTDVGQEAPLQIVCGAKNMKAGDKVPTAVVGATLPGGFKIGGRKMRGVESQGMMCAADELGLGGNHEGLLILDESLEIGADVKPILGLDDIVMEIEVIPNRGDWASMIGVARELAALYDTAFKIPEITVTESEEKAGDLSSVTIEDTERCPRYIGGVLSNVKVGPSPAWMCQRLIAAGQRPINNIVDITNYVLLETGHPLHAFDYEKLAENRVVVRCAKPGEVMTTLDDEKRQLEEDMLVIADAKEPQAVAGVMGGADSEVGETSTKIFLESAYFLPASVRKTSRTLGLISEASQHFQRGADPEMAVYAINRCAMLMQELAGATVAQGLIDEYPAPLPVPEVTLRYARTNALLGAQIDPAFQQKALKALCFKIIAEDADSCTVSVPTWRHDVSMETDLIEEVARLYSYDNIPTTLPRVRQGEHVFAPMENQVRALRRYLVSQGLTEFYAWTFSNPKDVAKAGLSEKYQAMVALENPLSENQATMQSSLLPGMLNATAFNLHRGAQSLAAFQIGPAFLEKEGAELPIQEYRLCIVLAGNAEKNHWVTPQRAFDFYDIKGYFEQLLDYFGLKLKLKALEIETLQAGQSAEILLKKNSLGLLGKVNHQLLKNYDTDQDIYVLEIALDRLLEKKGSPAQFQNIPTFPPSLRDMALLVDAEVPAAKLLNTSQTTGGKLLKKAEIFDVYQGDQVPKGKKSIAISLTFQSEERTLTDKDTQKAYDKILKRLEKDFGAQLR